MDCNNVCAICKKELNGYFSIEMNGKHFKICEDCNTNLKNDETQIYKSALNSSESIEELKKKEEERIEKKLVAQRNDPLYDDIHQIATDLRLLRNIVVIGLIISIISFFL